MSYLEIKNLTKKYKDGESVFTCLKNISLKFDIGEFVFILGESGCGKSTLLNCILGIVYFDEGKILLNNQEINKLSERKKDKLRGEEIGVIFQKYNLINFLTVSENIALSKNNNDSDEEKLKILNIASLKNNLVSKLSGGESQRAAIVRALVNHPSLLILDEATGALDEKNTKVFLDFLKKISKDKLILFVTHNEEIASKYATRIIKMKEGKVVSDTVKEKVEVSRKVQRKAKFYFSKRFLYAFKLFKLKKGRFILSIVSSFFLLFFLSLGIMISSFGSEFIAFTFLSSLDSNVLEIVSYKEVEGNIEECEVSPLVLNNLRSSNYQIRKSLDNFLNQVFLNNIYYLVDNKKIDLRFVSLRCSGLEMDGKVVINENLYNYLLQEDNQNIINKRIYLNNKELGIQKDFKIDNISKASLMNDSMIIYFSYDYLISFIKEYKLEIDNYLTSYQLIINDIKEVDEVLDNLKESTFYVEEDKEIKEYNFSFKCNEDLENYLLFYELINMCKIVLFFFIFLAFIISLVLLNSVIYSITLEEMRNFAILKVLGISYLDIYSLLAIVSFINSLISFFINLLGVYLLNKYLEDVIVKLLNYPSKVFYLTNENILFLGAISLFLTFINGIYAFIKLKFTSLNEALKEEV